MGAVSRSARILPVRENSVHQLPGNIQAGYFKKSHHSGRDMTDFSGGTQDRSPGFVRSKTHDGGPVY